MLIKIAFSVPGTFLNRRGQQGVHSSAAASADSCGYSVKQIGTPICVPAISCLRKSGPFPLSQTVFQSQALGEQVHDHEVSFRQSTSDRFLRLPNARLPQYHDRQRNWTVGYHNYSVYVCTCIRAYVCVCVLKMCYWKKTLKLFLSLRPTEVSSALRISLFFLVLLLSSRN